MNYEKFKFDMTVLVKTLIVNTDEFSWLDLTVNVDQNLNWSYQTSKNNIKQKYKKSIHGPYWANVVLGKDATISIAVQSIMDQIFASIKLSKLKK